MHARWFNTSRSLTGAGLMTAADRGRLRTATVDDDGFIYIAGKGEGENALGQLYKFAPDGTFIGSVIFANFGDQSAIHDVIVIGSGSDHKIIVAGVMVEGNFDYTWLVGEIPCDDEAGCP